MTLKVLAEEIVACHPSRQNTNTGKLMRAMFDEIFDRARSLLETMPDVA